MSAALLRARGLRATPTRLAVLAVLGTTPLTFAELHALLPSADRATVFRTLRALVRVGLARDLRGDHGLRYKRASTRIEAHFTCIGCGRSFALAMTDLPAHTVEVVVRGRCDRCA